MKTISIAALLGLSACGACPSILYFALSVTVVDVNGVPICDATVTAERVGSDAEPLAVIAGDPCTYGGAQGDGELVIRVSRRGYDDASETVTVASTSGACAHAVLEHVTITLRH